ncbi:CLUMA_CG008004, isoform A [Clunio marinus]|uniref:CLUMA_CG008004, isoform A n=1 Tax=Clunio marinus TaxID=568069 RepID=A0A1J1I2S3_9DIPT|nr:CLUMA_CG008004, isoform A [Clunio marinus]
MGFIAYFFVVVIIIVVWYQTKYLRRSCLLQKIPAFRSYPVIGSSLSFIGKSAVDIFKVVEDASKLGPIFRFDFSPFKSLIICNDPKVVEGILSSQELIVKSYQYDYMKDWLSDGLLLSTGRKWHQRRKIITPTFHFNILQQFADIMDRHGKIFVSNLKKFEGQEIDFFSPVSLYALDVICESAMGCKVNAQEDSESEYVKAVKEISNIIFLRMFDSLKQFQFIYQFTKMYQREQKALKLLHDFTDSVIVSRRKELESTSHADNNENDFGIKKRTAFLDLMLQSTIDGNPLTNSDIREEVDTFMFEGHDTTKSGICFTFYNLAKYPEIQEKVFDECRTILGDDTQQSVTMQELNNLHYLELVIKETLRLYPSVPFFGRDIKEEVSVGGITVPEKVAITISPYLLGRNPKIFSDPLKFDPLRFEAETNNEKNNPYAYVPFSAGPRNCIGQKFAMLEMKSIISKVIRNFKLSISKDNEDLKLIAELILRPENGIVLRVQNRFD